MRLTRLCEALLEALKDVANAASASPREAVDDEIDEEIGAHVERLSYLLELQGPYDPPDDLIRAMRAA